MLFRLTLAMALALALPESPTRSAILAASYAVVLFAVIVQDACQHEKQVRQAIQVNDHLRVDCFDACQTHHIALSTPGVNVNSAPVSALMATTLNGVEAPPANFFCSASNNCCCRMRVWTAAR